MKTGLKPNNKILKFLKNLKLLPFILLQSFFFSLAQSAPLISDHPRELKVAMAQISLSVGNFNQTFSDIEKAYQRAEGLGADLIVFPEGVIPGYPAWDLYFRSDFIENGNRMLADLKQITRGKSTAILIGQIKTNPVEIGKPLVNKAVLIDDGKIIFEQNKMSLPTYGPFVDDRYFQSADKVRVINFRGFRLGIAICEDWWSQDNQNGRKLYLKDPIDHFRKNKIDLAIALATSPYSRDKVAYREQVHRDAIKTMGVPLIYVNQVGSEHSMVFDGHSFVLDNKGLPVARFNGFQPDFEIVRLVKNSNRSSAKIEGFLVNKNRSVMTSESEDRNVLEAISLGIRSYLNKINKKKVVFGLSGGLDSAVVAAIAAHAIGPENVIVILMPSNYSSEGSINHSLELIRNLGILKENVHVIPISRAYSTLLNTLVNSATNQNRFPDDLQIQSISKFLADFEAPSIENLNIDTLISGSDNIPYQNIQARLRMILEFHISYTHNALKLHTGDLSEILMGYTTQYGDSAGSYSVLLSLLKTEVFAMGHFYNQLYEREVIPHSILNKPPSAELAPGQLTENDLIPYSILDSILIDLERNGFTRDQIRAKYGNALPGKGDNWIETIFSRMTTAQWKISQGPPGPVVIGSGASTLYRMIAPDALQHSEYSPKKVCSTLFVN